MNPRVLSLIVLIILIGIGAYLAFGHARPATAPSGPTANANGLITLALGQTGTAGALTLEPLSVVEDSRCPEDVQCIQAGRIRVRVSLAAGMGKADQVFTIGEPITTEAETVTLTAVTPAKNSKVQIADSDYRFTFKILKNALSYANASADLITVSLPYPGAVTGRDFSVKGQARGPWYFEASFPVKVLDKDGNVLASVPAQAEGDWMTTDFVSFTAALSVPASYSGPATLVLQKDNPSGDPSKDASLSFPITIAE